LLVAGCWLLVAGCWRLAVDRARFGARSAPLLDLATQRTMQAVQQPPRCRADTLEGLGDRIGHIAESTTDFQARLEFTVRTKGDGDMIAESPVAVATRAFSNVGRNRNGGPTKLACQTEQFLMRKRPGCRVTLFYETHSLLPDVETSIRRAHDVLIACLGEGRSARLHIIDSPCNGRQPMCRPATSHQPPATSHQPPATSNQPPAVTLY
jgi:hypothetical protein